MGGHVDIASTLANDDFKALPDAEKQKFLTTYVPEFGSLHPDEQTKFLEKYVGIKASSSPLGAPPEMPQMGAREDGFFERAKRMVENSTIGRTMRSDLPGFADALNIHPDVRDEYGELRSQQDKQLLQPEELMSTQQDSAGGQIARGALRAAGRLTNAPNLLMLAGGGPLLGGLEGVTANLLGRMGMKVAPSVISRVIAGGFSADILHNLYQQGGEFKKKVDAGDQQGAMDLLGQMAVDSVMAVMTAHHAATGEGMPTRRGAGPEKVPTKINLNQEGHLVDKLGYTQEQVAQMTPVQARDIIKAKRKAAPGDFPTPAPRPAPEVKAEATPAPEEAGPLGAQPAPPVDIPEGNPEARNSARSRLEEIAYQKGYDVKTYLAKLRADREQGNATKEETDAVDAAEQETPFQSEKVVNTTMADKLKTELGRMKEKEELTAHLDQVATENLYSDTADMVRSLNEKKLRGTALSPMEKEALAQADRLEKLPSFELKKQEVGPLGEMPKPPGQAQKPTAKAAAATATAPQAPSNPTIPTARPTMGPYQPEQVSWFTSLFKGKSEMGTTDFDIAAGHYGDTDAMIEQMKQAGVIEESGREVVGKGKDRKVYPSYKLTDHGLELRKAWASRKFPGEIPEGPAATPTAKTAGGDEGTTRGRETPPSIPEPPAQPLFDDELGITAKDEPVSERRSGPRSDTSRMVLNQLHSELRAESDPAKKAEIQTAIDRETRMGAEDATAKAAPPVEEKKTEPGPPSRNVNSTQPPLSREAIERSTQAGKSIEELHSIKLNDGTNGSLKQKFFRYGDGQWAIDIALDDAGGKRIANATINKTELGPDGSSPRSLRLFMTDLASSYQGKGIGKQLYLEAMSAARRAGAQYLESDVQVSPSARRVWESLQKQFPDAIEAIGETGRFRANLEKVGEMPEQEPAHDKHIRNAGLEKTGTIGGDTENPVHMIEHPELKGKGFQVSLKESDITSPDVARKALRDKLQELNQPIPTSLKTKAEIDAEHDVYTPGKEIPSIKGKETIVDTPNGAHKAVYRWVEADDLQTSHNPLTFERNPNYPIENERQYHNNKNAQNETETYAKDEKWHLYVNGDPTTSNGPSQSLPDGAVLGGNGRDMGLRIAYDKLGNGESYKQYLIDHVGDYAKYPQDVAEIKSKISEMKRPVLDRMIVDAPTSKKALEAMGKDFNKGFAKKASAVEAAVSAGTSLSIESARKVGEGITNMGDEASLRKLFTEEPQMFRDIALQDGILAEGDLPQYFEDNGTINDAGKDFFENMLLGSVVRDADLLKSMPASLKAKLERALAPVLEVSQRPDTWNIGDDLRAAIKESVSASAASKNIKDWVRQTGFDNEGKMREPVPENVATLAVALSRKPTQVGEAFKRYAAEARQDIPGQDNIFGAPDPREAFDRIFKGEGTGGSGAATAFRARMAAEKRALPGQPLPPNMKPAAEYMEIPVRPMESPIKEFYKEDVLPQATSGADGVKEGWRRFRNIVAPVNAENKNLALNIRRFGAETTRSMHQFKNGNEEVWDFFTKFDREARMHNVSMVDAGRSAELAKELDAPQLEHWVNTVAAARRKAWAQALKYKGAEASEMTRPDYWLGHYYVTEDGRPLGTILSKRSLEGGKSFFKKREFPTMAQFIDFAKENYDVVVKPKFDNPVEFEAAKLGEINRYIEGQRILEAQEAAGRVKVVHALDQSNAPAGWEKLPDNLGTIYAPPTYTVSEAFDDLMMKRINDLTKSLGVSHTRKVNVGGRDRWGYSETGNSTIVSKVGGPESVITHELGHVMDDRYGLKDRWVNDPFMKREFRDLADLRAEGHTATDGFQKYIRKGSEKIANAFHAYVHNPEAMDRVAPTVKKAIDLLIDEHPELKPLREIKPSQTLGTAGYEASTGHIGIMAYRYVPAADVPLYRNYTSGGLKDNPIFNGYRQAANFMNSLQLGFSGFHAGFTLNDAAASRFSLGAQKIAHGDVWNGVKDLATGNILVAPVQSWLTGTRMIDGYETGNPADPGVATALDYLVRAGGADRMDDFYRSGALHSFWDEFHSGNKIGAGIRAVPAATEFTSNLVLDKLVPRLKLATFKELAEFEIKKLHDNYAKDGLKPTEMDENAVLARAWDSIENRMGQLRYQNLFWNKTFKDLSLASVRSVGWNLGTFREFGGAVGDLVKGSYNAVSGKGKFELTPRMAYALIYPVVMGLQGAVATYLMTGKSPEEIKDYYFWKTGRKNADGTDERVMPPSYVKDLYAYGSGFETGVGDGVTNVEKVMSHKVHPFLSMIMDLHNNVDYRNVEIRDPEDPIGTQIADFAEYVAKQFVPFAVTNAEKRLELTDKSGAAAIFSPETLSSFFGITPAPRGIDRTRAQQLAYKYKRETNPPGVRTNEANERMRMHGQVIQQLKSDLAGGLAHIEQGIKDGNLTQRDVAYFRTHYKTTWLQQTTRQLSLKRALAVYDAGTPEEQDALRKVIAIKARNEMPKLQPKEQQELLERVKKIIGQDATPKTATIISEPPSPPRLAQVPQ